MCAWIVRTHKRIYYLLLFLKRNSSGTRARVSYSPFVSYNNINYCYYCVIIIIIITGPTRWRDGNVNWQTHPCRIGYAFPENATSKSNFTHMFHRRTFHQSLPNCDFSIFFFFLSSVFSFVDCTNSYDRVHTGKKPFRKDVTKYEYPLPVSNSHFFKFFPLPTVLTCRNVNWRERYCTFEM